MTNQTIIENKISSIEKYLKILEKYLTLSKEEIVNDIDIKGAVERYLYLVTQTTIDLSEAIISLKRFRKPTTHSESFTILAENSIITKELEIKLIKMAGFRNALAHGYEKLDYDILYDALHNKLSDIKDFISIVNKA